MHDHHPKLLHVLSKLMPRKYPLYSLLSSLIYFVIYMAMKVEPLFQLLPNPLNVLSFFVKSIAIVILICANIVNSATYFWPRSCPSTYSCYQMWSILWWRARTINSYPTHTFPLCGSPSRCWHESVLCRDEAVFCHCKVTGGCIKVESTCSPSLKPIQPTIKLWLAKNHL